MTPKTIFTIVLKVFGLWLIIGVLEFIPTILPMLPMLMMADHESATRAIVIMSLVSLLYILIVWSLLFKTSFIIDKLSLDKHFEQDAFELNVRQSAIIQMAIIIMGGVIAISSIPSLIEQTVSYLQQKELSKNLYTHPSFEYIILHTSKIIIGYLLMNNSRWLMSRVDGVKEEV